MRQQRRLAAVRRQRRLAPVLRLAVLRLPMLGLAVLGLAVVRLRLPVVLLGLAVLLLRRLAELVVARRGLWGTVLVLRLLLELVLRRWELLVLLRRILLLRRELVLWLLLLEGFRCLLLRRSPRVGSLLLRLRHPPRVRGRLLLRLAPVLGLALLRLPVVLLGLSVVLRRLAVLGLRLPVLALPLLTLSVLVGGRRLRHGLLPPRVGRLLLRLAPRVLRRLRRRLLLGSLLPVRVVLRLPVLGLAVLRLPLLGSPVLLAALRARRLAVPPGALLGRAAAGARQVGPAAHAEQIARLERLVTDRTVQGRHDTSPERTPARSSLDVRCSMSPLRGIPM
ncbi:hypothetical protein E1293_26350 [Actinomadura darangshiensis]|uniref:Uncharacterized protein n=1 Tax=Actinomadura darangshiensis TaxID=705336 RepID=A0A4R5B1B7_9ACTN|nr:hypothetical protein [Actinomadura darangshiensis]TDD76782.1 hypothetical protein E1293_26350 [Actinomadura darangshiensis]